MRIIYVVTVCLTCIQYVVADFRLEIKNSGPTVAGGKIHFVAELFDGDKKADGKFLFEWQDNSLLRHHREKQTTGYRDSWTVSYPRADCPPGVYVMQVIVKNYWFFVPVEITSLRINFELTSTLGGSLNLIQNNTVRSQYVSNTTTVLHKVQLSSSDMEYLNTTATQILSYWFVDCVYYGITQNMEFLMNYANVDDSHVVEAFIIPNFDPFPTEAPTTTTPTTTTTTTTTTTSKPPAISTTTLNPRGIKLKRSATELITNFDPVSMKDIIYKNLSTFTNRTVKYNNSFPFICNNHTIVPILSDIPYGYFNRKFTVRDPVRNISVSGNNWIQRSEVLNLDVNCKGSSSFTYCFYFKYGTYNATGNETCPEGTTYEAQNCSFTIHRYFYDDEKRTAVIIINNDVSTGVFPVAITVYKVNKQAQLSVIVVPVGFSLAAIVLIIFGLAFYVQNRPRFFVEVADFNFGQHYDMEYKTFTERLKESFTNAFTRADTPTGSSEGDPVWHTSENNYDSIS